MYDVHYNHRMKTMGSSKTLEENCNHFAKETIWSSFWVLDVKHRKIKVQPYRKKIKDVSISFWMPVPRPKNGTFLIQSIFNINMLNKHLLKIPFLQQNLLLI